MLSLSQKRIRTQFVGLVLGRWLISTPSEVAWRAAPPPLFCGVCYLKVAAAMEKHTHTNTTGTETLLWQPETKSQVGGPAALSRGYFTQCTYTLSPHQYNLSSLLWPERIVGTTGQEIQCFQVQPVTCRHRSGCFFINLRHILQPVTCRHLPGCFFINLRHIL